MKTSDQTYRDPRTDLGNAEAFTRQHADHLRYSHADGKWWVSDGGDGYWYPDEKGCAVEYAKATVYLIERQAQLLIDDHEADLVVRNRGYELRRWARKSATPTRIKAMLWLAQSDPAFAIADAHDLQQYPVES